MFQSGTLITGTAYDDFFKWVGAQPHLLRLDRDRDEAASAFLVVVDEGLRRQFVEEVGDGSLPAPEGVYAAVWDSDGVIHAFGYGNALETAATEFNAAYPPYGEDPGDTGRIEVVRVRKPAAVVARSEATVRVSGSATYEEVLAAGLAALGETKDRLQDWRVRPEGAGASADLTDSKPIEDTTVTVVAYKD
jgi:hypothetical protein